MRTMRPFAVFTSREVTNTYTGLAQTLEEALKIIAAQLLGCRVAVRQREETVSLVELGLVEASHGPRFGFVLDTPDAFTARQSDGAFTITGVHAEHDRIMTSIVSLAGKPTM